MLNHCFIPETNVVITLEISYTSTEKKKKRHAATKSGERPREHRGRASIYVAITQGSQGAARSWKKRGSVHPLGASQEAQC